MRRLQSAAGRLMMTDRMHRVTLEIMRGMGRRIGPFAGFLGALNGAFVDRRIEYALALLLAVLLLHRRVDLLALGREWHRRILSVHRRRMKKLADEIDHVERHGKTNAEAQTKQKIGNRLLHHCTLMFGMNGNHGRGGSISLAPGGMPRSISFWQWLAMLRRSRSRYGAASTKRSPRLASNFT